MTAQIILLSMRLISGFIQANKHGKPKEGKESFWYWLIGFAINFKDDYARESSLIELADRFSTFVINGKQ